MGYNIPSGYNAPTDSNGNTYTALNTGNGFGSQGNIIYYAANPTTSSSHTFTETTWYQGFCVQAFSGIATSSPFDAQNSGALSPGSVTPNFNNELIVTGLANYCGGATGINDSFTIPASNGQIGCVDNKYYGVAMAYLVQTTAAAVSPTWTTNASNAYTSNIATFKAAAPSQGYSLIQGNSKISGNSTINP